MQYINLKRKLCQLLYEFLGNRTIEPLRHLILIRAYWILFTLNCKRLLCDIRSRFSPGTPASSTTKTGRHDIVEMLLKVSLKHQKSNTSINRITIHWHGEYNIQFVINLKWENMPPFSTNTIHNWWLGIHI
jgi:hypothetical protein